ncbi:MAG TPA: undecaprenyl/decaprenyl-phosphate alpha-N-acetylglucosaminyl 1-phosphate transferase [Bacteroidales bacterium]|nr:MAG: hypothetical protein A2W98_14490 [Bacteroidetes bacterium GWF2_33_38]HBF88494.1 undecaprenyl/decaprenyl-phosphate alpha-N-acetylglucosaminyl 1-phosphate transferase [Bacteroidales bacterium]
MFKTFDIGLIIAAFTIAFMLGMAFIPYIINFSKKRNLFDAPNIRKIHKIKISRLGGIGIFISFTISFIIFSFLFQFDPQLLYLAASVIILFITGVVDDVKNIKANVKFIIQIVAAFILVYGGFRLETLFGFFGIFELPIVIQYILSIIIIVGVTNAFNLIDGIDGLAGGVGLVNFLSLGIIFLYLNNVSYALISFAIAGSILAFLFYNFNPARIFMGDAGSLVLGFMMVALGLFVIKNSNEAFSSLSISNPHILIGGILLVPVIDTIRVMSQRILRKQSPFIADQNHFHHILLKRGFSHKEIVLIIAGSNVLVILVSLMIKDITLNSSVLSLFLVW